MIKVNCIECGDEFEIEYFRGRKKGFCSEECRRKRAARANKEWSKILKGKESRKRYRISERGKEAAERYRKSEKGKTGGKRYRESEKGRETIKRYQSREDVKKKKNERAKEYYKNNKERIDKKHKEDYIKKKGKFYTLSDEEQLELINKRSMEILNGENASKRKL